MSFKKLLLTILSVLLFSLPAEAVSLNFSWDKVPEGEHVTHWRLDYQLEDNTIQSVNIPATGQENPSHTLIISNLGTYFFWLTAIGIGESSPTSKIKVNLSIPSSPTNLLLTIKLGFIE